MSYALSSTLRHNKLGPKHWYGCYKVSEILMNERFHRYSVKDTMLVAEHSYSEGTQRYQYDLCNHELCAPYTPEPKATGYDANATDSEAERI